MSERVERIAVLCDALETDQLTRSNYRELSGYLGELSQASQEEVSALRRCVSVAVERSDGPVHHFDPQVVLRRTNMHHLVHLWACSMHPFNLRPHYATQAFYLGNPDTVRTIASLTVSESLPMWVPHQSVETRLIHRLFYRLFGRDNGTLRYLLGGEVVRTHKVDTGREHVVGLNLWVPSGATLDLSLDNPDLMLEGSIQIGVVAETL